MFDEVCRYYSYVFRHIKFKLYINIQEREVRLRARKEEMKERDAEINRLLGELRRCQTQLLEQQV